jgi:hypothetical protein
MAEKDEIPLRATKNPTPHFAGFYLFLCHHDKIKLEHVIAPQIVRTAVEFAQSIAFPQIDYARTSIALPLYGAKTLSILICSRPRADFVW